MCQSKTRREEKQIAEREKDRGEERLMKVREGEGRGKKGEEMMSGMIKEKRDGGIVEESLWICRIPLASSFGTKSH